MMIKIMLGGHGSKWWLVDNIAKVSLNEGHYLCEVKTKKLSCDYGTFEEFISNVDAVLLRKRDRITDDDKLYGKMDDQNNLIIPCNTLHCKLKSGETYSILYDTVAYILNDEGKTIDKIVANY